MKVAQVMTSKVETAGAGTPYKDVVERLVRAGVSSIPVVDDESHLVGIVTEADLISKEAFPAVHHRGIAAMFEVLSGSSKEWLSKAEAATAADLMTRDPVTCSPDEDVRVAARRMLREKVKRLPVVEHGVLVGIVSRHDLLSVYDRPDAEICAEVRRLLHESAERPEDGSISCSVSDGVVVLQGDLRYQSDAGVVVALAREVPGVVDVVSHLHGREANPRHDSREFEPDPSDSWKRTFDSH
ncbi:MAG TPA: CBS domain-containing protein [Acidimicrobiales bacterium]|nr:CBS domain-containing protein [Acidimicrobiales bacterium]